jgi:hypothetical protein
MAGLMGCAQLFQEQTPKQPGMHVHGQEEAWPASNSRLVRHGRYVTFQLAEGAVPRELFLKILSLIDDLRRRPAPA